MTPLEIALLVIGALIFILSFAIPVKKRETSEEIKDMIGEEVKLKVKSEIEELRSHIDGVVDEAIEYAQEKTERSLERISNEKIMAVNEYSDTVLDEINKNHKEVMFLYDMLNDKHEDLKNAVSEASVVAKTAKENAEAAEAAAEAVQESTSKAEAAITNFKSLAPETVTVARTVSEADSPVISSVVSEPSSEKESEKNVNKPVEKTVSEPAFRTLKWAEFAMEQADEAYVQETGNEPPAVVPPTEIVEEKKEPEEVTAAQRKDQVIALHKLGKSDIDIARALDMGVGEVSLIIGLHAK